MEKSQVIASYHCLSCDIRWERRHRLDIYRRMIPIIEDGTRCPKCGKHGIMGNYSVSWPPQGAIFTWDEKPT